MARISIDELNKYSSKKLESDDEELFEKFKQFIRFQRLMKDS